MEGFADIANVKGILWAGLPGQEAGNALVDVLYGDTNPGGKLPFSIAKKQAEYGTTIQANTDSFSEGLYIDYRALDKKGIAPRYEFGFGLSYTTFNYSNIAITGAPTSGPESGATIPGGASSLFDIVSTVTATITNSGAVAGSEVAQLYVGLPPSAPETPIRQLRGFQKLKDMKAGEIREVKFQLKRKDLSYWDKDAKKWVLPKGDFKVEVGASSKDLKLSGKITAA